MKRLPKKSITMEMCTYALTLFGTTDHPVTIVIEPMPSPVPKTEVIRMGECIIPLDVSYIIETYWYDQEYGLKSMTEYVTDLFRCDVNCIGIEGEEGVWMMDWVQNRQNSLDFICAKHLKPISEHSFRHILLNSNSKTLVAQGKVPDTFRMVDFHKKIDDFTCFDGQWMTMDNVMTLDSMEISISEKKFSSEELNLFLRHWICGGSRRLGLLRIQVENYNEQEAFEGIHVEQTGKKRVYERQNDIIEFFGMEIRRNDGVIASIRHFPGGNGLFRMLV